MSAWTDSPAVQTTDIADRYQELYDLLRKAYWEASDVDSKDLIYSVEHEIGDIIDQLDTDDIAELTKRFIELKPKITAVNQALERVKEQIHQITKNIATAGALLAAIAKVVSMVPAA